MLWPKHHPGSSRCLPDSIACPLSGIGHRTSLRPSRVEATVVPHAWDRVECKPSRYCQIIGGHNTLLSLSQQFGHQRQPDSPPRDVLVVNSTIEKKLTLQSAHGLTEPKSFANALLVSQLHCRKVEP